MCSVCVRGKQVNASFKPLKSVSTLRCLEFLHMDLCGLIHIRSLGGGSYIFVMVDDYSKFTWMIFLKDKTEALKEFVKLC